MKNHNILTKNTKRAAVATLSAFVVAGCGGADDYDKQTVETRVGVSCSGGENIVMTKFKVSASKQETPKGDKDMSNFALTFFCETGRMTMTELPQQVGTEGQDPVDNIVTITTEDKYGTRANEGNVVGTATRQSVEIDNITGDNYGVINLSNADKVVAVEVVKDAGYTETIDFEAYQQ